MIFQPDVLVLDEPDSFLDQHGKAALRDELKRIRLLKPDMIQIHITQYISVARNYQRLLVFHDGGIKADNAPEKILSDMSFCRTTGLVFSAADRRREIVPAYETAMNIARERRLSAIRFDNISFRYPGTDFIIRNLSGEMRSGEVVGVAGFSGSGKSTLGSLVCNLLKPTEGRIALIGPGGDELELRSVPGKVTGVLQQPERQFFLPTCLEEITFGPRNLGQYIDRGRIKSLFELVGLETDRFYDRDPFNLSGGEKRRLAFAAVLSMSPDFVVFDEPTCSLDPEGVGRFILLAEALKNSGVGLLVISHDGDVIKALADKIICLRDKADYEIMSAARFFAAPEYYRLVSPASPSPDSVA